MKRVKEKINRCLKNRIFIFVLGILLSGSVSVFAATYFPSDDVSYDNSASGMQSTDVQGAIDELYQLASAIDMGGIKVPSETENGGIYEDEHGDLRYYGSDPNNYVSFNNELWRVLGVIDEKIKIIRNDALTPVTTDNGVTIGTSSGFYWNKVKQSGKNDNNWEGSTLQTYLNGTYYNSINSTYRNMISEETYYLGGATSSNYQTLTASGYYNAERDSNAVYSGNPATTTQHIGLMYPSDYGYAAGSSCLSTALYSYDSSCKNSDYLLSGATEWLQAPPASRSNSSASLNYNGTVVGIGYYVNSSSFAARPVLYLNTNVKITGGDGSQSNPYTLS